MDTQHIQAIFQDGKLLPLQPLDLKDHEQVDLTVSRQEPDDRSATNSYNTDPLLGILSDATEVADQITESAMNARETRPLRVSRG